MVNIIAGAKNFFWKKYQIQIADMNHQAHGYFGLLGIGNVGNQVIPDPLVVSNLQNMDGDTQTVQTFYDKVHSYMIAKEIESSILKHNSINAGLIEGNMNGMMLSVS